MSGTLLAELYYRTQPTLDGEAIVDAIRAAGEEVDLVGDSPVLVAFPALVHRFPDGRAGPLMATVIGPTGRDPATDKPVDLSQTWGWDNAAAVLDETTHTVAIGELMGRVHPSADRLRVFRAVLDAVVDHSRPALTWWPISVTALPPVLAQERPVAGLVNVRLFHDETRPDRLVMDTLGLDSFGLPDVQCSFRDLPTGQVAALLYATARYMIDGAVIVSGHTVQGLAPSQRWKVTLAAPLVPPDRAVLDLNPGPPHAA